MYLKQSSSSPSFSATGQFQVVHTNGTQLQDPLLGNLYTSSDTTTDAEINSVGNLGFGIIAPQTRPTFKTTYNTENTGFKVRCLRWNYL